MKRTGIRSATILPICAARNRLAPATISKLFSVRGRTRRGERTPWLRMLSARSSRAASSKLRGGFVLDSWRSESETLLYSVALRMVVSMVLAPFERLRVEGEKSGHRLVYPLHKRGLATNRLFRECFEKT